MIRAREDTETNFHWLVKILKQRQGDTPRMLIFFNRTAVLNAVYLYLTHNIDQQPGDVKPLVAMFSKTTSEQCKKHVMLNMTKDSNLRVVLCTSSLSVGVNLTLIEYVVHYGPPSTASDFLQETGRAAREASSSALSVVITYPRMVKKHTSTTMRAYVSAANSCCRRALLLKPFNVTPDSQDDCCDVCQPQHYNNDILIKALRAQFPSCYAITPCSSSSSLDSLDLDLSVLDIGRN